MLNRLLILGALSLWLGFWPWILRSTAGARYWPMLEVDPPVGHWQSYPPPFPYWALLGAVCLASIGIYYAAMAMRLTNWKQWFTLGSLGSWVGLLSWMVAKATIPEYRWHGYTWYRTPPEYSPGHQLLPLILLCLPAVAVASGLMAHFQAPGWLWTRFRQLTSERKQLAVLLVAATWTSLMVLLEGPRPSRVFVLSLPALLFGGILFWWFGRKPSPSRPSQESSVLCRAATSRSPDTNRRQVAAAAPKRLSYRWGRIQGWLLMIGAPVAFLLVALWLPMLLDSVGLASMYGGPGTELDPQAEFRRIMGISPAQERGIGFVAPAPQIAGLIFYLVTVIALFPAGHGLLSKRRYGLILFHLLLVLNTTGAALADFSERAEGSPQVMTAGLYWLVNTVYFHRRRHEFH